ncbi:peroxiredoxin [Craterilacuibacter sinensis]|uniref:thioredoxin-dependent peroxiredoxin n=1 Tax=Craterilacuibacter sinensis TaxID=2686017 RepID=A0A845BNG7_9NEIS|nr:peroxiredoxin [Craterilacuibacter sinensis]MXR37819.1 redoxin domain-containing protein [Craterilacuibacter sinensis]
MDGQTCPDFTLPATSGLSFTLSSAQKPLVLYFYPKDNTPGCSNEAAAFRDLYSEFQAAGADIAGISRDSLKSHENFKTKFSLPFALLSDSEEVACGLFDVIKQKKMYGKEVRGIERSTFVIGADNQVLKSWRGVKVAEHATEVLAYIKGL